jgi:(2Fe-2S) ferredoxin
LNLPFRKHVLVCVGPRCGGERGSARVRQEIRKEFVRQGMLTGVKETECICFGLCRSGPNVIVYPDGVVYAGVKPQDVAQIVREHLGAGRVVDRLLYRPRQAAPDTASPGTDGAAVDAEAPATVDPPSCGGDGTGRPGRSSS